MQALRRGVHAAGGSPEFLGVLPTPAVAVWCEQRNVAGAMVSASHNPWHDNGVKFFAPGGLKLSDRQQQGIETRLAQLHDALGGLESSDGQQQGIETRLARLHDAPSSEAGEILEQLTPSGDARERHVESVVASLSQFDDSEGFYALAGMKLVVDCANGSASDSGPECLRRLGADVIAVHDRPDGHNINDDCGSLHPQSLQRAVQDHQADAGLAFDGDADRVLAVDHLGRLVDGDEILAVCAIDRRERGLLAGDTVVVTVMANLGLRRSLEANGIAIIETAVGDRHVLGALEQHRLVLGGEQSGHLIFRDLATTGCGMLTAVQLLDAVKRSGKSLHEAASAAMTRIPQVLINVSLDDPDKWFRVDGAADELARLQRRANERLGKQGRALLRESGTEPMVRVMVEAFDAGAAQAEAQRLALEVEKVLS